MRRMGWLVMLGLVASTARAQLVPVRLTVMVGDSAAPPVPVPHFVLMIRPGMGAAVPAVTDQRGVAVTSLPIGDYRVTSFEPYPWHGRRFEWDLELSVRGDSIALDLTAANAGPWRPSTGAWPGIARGVGVEPNASVRVTTMRGERYTARVVGVLQPDTLWVQRSGDRIALPNRTLAMLEVGRRSYELGVAVGVALGLAGGVLFGHAKTYLAGGALLGLLFPIESWEPVPLFRP